MQSNPSKPSVNFNDVKSGIPCPRTLFFLIHDSSTNNYRMFIIKANEDFSQSPTEAIVHAAVISDFAAYFVFLDDNSCSNAMNAIGNLIVDSVALSLDSKFRASPIVPTQLSILYNRTVNVLRTLANGCFLTEIFLRKLWELTYRIWRHVQAYIQWLRPKAIPQKLVTELIC